MFLKYFIPNKFVESIYQIDISALKKQGVKGVITDLDNTLMEADSPNYSPKLVKWLDDLQEIGFSVIILSNNTKTRIEPVAKALTVPFIDKAQKPRRSGFVRALSYLKLQPHEVVVIGDQLLTDVLGGNRMGIYTILVVPISQHEGFFTKINRQIERIIWKQLHKKNLIPWEDNDGK